MRNSSISSIAIACLAVAAAVPNEAVAAPLSSASMAEKSPFSGPTLSPDGGKMMARSSSNGRDILMIVDLATSKLTPVGLAEKQDLLDYDWAGNGRVVLTVGAELPFYGNGERYVTRLYSYNLATGKLVELGPKVQGQQTRLVWIAPKGDSMLLTTQANQMEYPTVYRANVDTGAAKLEQGPYDMAWTWYADWTGKIRYGSAFSDYNWFGYYRPGAGGDLRTQAKHKYDDKAAPEPLVILPGTDEGYALAPNAERRFALYKYNYASEQLGEKVFESPTNDIDSVIIDKKTKLPSGVVFTDSRYHIEWLDPTMKAVQRQLEGSFPNQTVIIRDYAEDKSRFLASAGSATDPGAYYLLDAATGRITSLGKLHGKVDTASLSPMRYIKYKARDGLEIPAYLTLPNDRPSKNLPLIIMPHGGPYGVRDSIGYDPEVQFLASRGYAVLQPNYRGSAGYGQAFYEKGEGQWGRAMQDDIDDGMDWLVKEGMVDAKRVCLVGASYGGYAALWGATRNPERYRCAVSLAGISDLAKQLDYQADFFTGTRWRKNWQSRVKGQKDSNLGAYSPLQQVARLRVPVMLAHGLDDETVPPKQSQQYDAALTAAGKVHETYVYPGEGHGFDDPKNEKDYLDKLEAFLTKYNPSR